MLNLQVCLCISFYQQYYLHCMIYFFSYNLVILFLWKMMNLHQFQFYENLLYNVMSSLSLLVWRHSVEKQLQFPILDLRGLSLLISSHIHVFQLLLVSIFAFSLFKLLMWLIHWFLGFLKPSHILLSLCPSYLQLSTSQSLQSVICGNISQKCDPIRRASCYVFEKLC